MPPGIRSGIADMVQGHAAAMTHAFGIRDVGADLGTRADENGG